MLLFYSHCRFILCKFYSVFSLYFCCTGAHERQALQLVLVTLDLVSRLCCVCVCLCSVRWCVSRSWSWRKRRGVCRLQRPDWGESGRERGSWQRASTERETGNEASQAPGPPQPFQPSPITPSCTTVRCSRTHTQALSRSCAPFYFLSLFWLSLFHTLCLSWNVSNFRLARRLPFFMHFAHPLSLCPISCDLQYPSQIHRRSLHPPPPTPLHFLPLSLGTVPVLWRSLLQR